jgi:hypothetical protein
MIDSMHWQKNGLTVDVDNKLTFQNVNDTSFGFLLFIGHLASPDKVPVTVPGDSEAFVTLGQPKKIQDIRQCYANDKVAPKLKRYGYYDQAGIFCAIDKVLDMSMKLLGCELPIINYFPMDDACFFSQTYVVSLVTKDIGFELGTIKVNSSTARLPKELQSFVSCCFF